MFPCGGGQSRRMMEENLFYCSMYQEVENIDMKHPSRKEPANINKLTGRKNTSPPNRNSINPKRSCFVSSEKREIQTTQPRIHEEC